MQTQCIHAQQKLFIWASQGTHRGFDREHLDAEEGSLWWRHDALPHQVHEEEQLAVLAAQKDLHVLRHLREPALLHDKPAGRRNCRAVNFTRYEMLHFSSCLR